MLHRVNTGCQEKERSKICVPHGSQARAEIPAAGRRNARSAICMPNSHKGQCPKNLGAHSVWRKGPRSPKPDAQPIRRRQQWKRPGGTRDSRGDRREGG